MIPSKSDPRWADLLTGRRPHAFETTSAAMLVSRHQRRLQQDPSPENLARSVEDVHAFFSRYESVLTEELKRVFR